MGNSKATVPLQHKVDMTNSHTMAVLPTRKGRALILPSKDMENRPHLAITREHTTIINRDTTTISR